MAAAKPGDKVERIVEIEESWPEFGHVPVYLPDVDDGLVPKELHESIVKDENDEELGRIEVRLADVEETLPRDLWAAVVVDDPVIGRYRPWRGELG